MEGLFACENLRFKIDWASLVVGRKFTLFALFYLRAVSKYKPLGGAYIWRSDLMEGFLRYEFGGPLFEGALWRGLFSEFYGIIFQISSFSRLFNVACNMYY